MKKVVRKKKAAIFILYVWGDGIDEAGGNQFYSLFRVVVDDVRPSDLAVTTISPACPVVVRTMTRASPLNAWRCLDWKETRLVASPLSVAIISPGPLSSN